MSEKITLKILYFAKLRDVLNKNSDTVSIDNNKILGKDIFEYAITINPNVRDELRILLDTCLISLNDEYIDREQEINLKQGDEISILPPISAG
jgi:molybdopterin converting factor small subunit